MNVQKATAKKRNDLQLVITQFLRPETSVHGVVAVGSVATGHARESSDIDAVLFMKPVDRYILPTESIWCPWDDTFHSIFVRDQHIHQNGIQLDLRFFDIVEWSSESFEWSEFDRAGLAEGWIAFDRYGEIEPLIKARTLVGHAIRANMLREISNEIMAKLRQEGIYGKDPASEAFIRTHDEPGRAWNMQEWNKKRKRAQVISDVSQSIRTHDYEGTMPKGERFDASG